MEYLENTAKNLVRRLTTIDYNFLPLDSVAFHLMEIPGETPWKIAENRTLKRGSSPPPSTWIKSLSVLSGLYSDTYDNTAFYVKNVIHKFFNFFGRHHNEKSQPSNKLS